MQFNLKGSIVALVTPFHEDGSVNYEALEDLLNWHVENKTDGILVLGTTGESSTMTHEEDDAVVEFTMKVINKRLPVIVGSGSNCTETAIEKSVKYANMGADALLLISPYYNKANSQGMIRHFTAVADAVDCPIILYNVPGRTGCSISEEAIKELCKHPKICGIKEASGNISYAANIARYVSDDFVMYSGNDDMIVPMMSLGAKGVISVLSNVLPAETQILCRAALAGDFDTAAALQIKFQPLVEALFSEVNPIPVKEAMKIIGFDCGGCRLPLTEASEETKKKLRHILN